jgi:Ca2+-transporting ATPase
MLWCGLLIGGLALGAQAWAWHNGSPNWQTITFTVLTLAQLVHALAIRAEHDSLFTLGIGSNRPLLGAVVLTLLLQLAVIYVPWCQEVLKTTPLTRQELAVCLLLPWVVLIAVEMEKALARRGWIYATPDKRSRRQNHLQQ